MATRNLYVSLCKTLQGSEALLKYSLFFVWFGGFLSIVLLSKLTGNPSAVNVGGRVLFSVGTLLGVMCIALGNFNPDRDLADKSPKESWLVIVLNMMVVMAIYVWFM